MPMPPEIVLIWFLCVLVVVYLMKLIFINFQKMYYIQKLDGPPMKNIFVGNIADLHAPPEETFALLRKWCLQYYPFYKLWIAHIVHVMIIGPEDNELVLKNVAHNKKGLLYALITDWLGTGLLTSTGKKWQKHRKILTPAFHYSILQNFVSIFNEETLKIVEFLKKNSITTPIMEVNALISHFTLKTICETSMGKKLEFIDEKEKSYKDAFNNLLDLLVPRMTRPWTFYKIFYAFNPSFYKERRLIKSLHAFTREIIKNRKITLKLDEFPKDTDDYLINGKRRRMAMLDLLLTMKNEEEGSLTDEEIREEVDTFLFEGHDTTAVALSYALMLIACHKDVQEKILEEMRLVLGDIRKPPSYNDLQEMKYLERVIKEVLRLYPSVPGIERILGEDLTLSNGAKIKRGTTAVVYIYGMHHHPKLYPDPEKFDPDRFLPENSRNRHPFAYIPFSAGPRNCIGQKYAFLELKAFICGILGSFILEPVDTPDTIVLVMNLIMRTKEPIKVKFVPRQKLSSPPTIFSLTSQHNVL